MKLLLFAASLRKASCNKKLIRVANEIVKEAGHETDFAEFDEFDMPLYNADIQDSQGFPQAMQDFIKRLNNSSGLIISSPEYNFSTPGTLKNLVDWVSRDKPMPWKDKRILLMSASPSLVGGNRGLWATRVPLECCGAIVYPDMFSLANAYEAFSEEGKLKDPKSMERLEGNVKAFLEFVGKLDKPFF